MRIITTHLGADFDALGAVMGALLIEPGSRVVFPGSQEAGVRRFLAAEQPPLPEIRLRDLRRAKLENAIVVDCASWRRLGEVGELIRAAGCPVRVVDHHPEGGDRIAAEELLTAPVAATCTVLAEELQRRGGPVDALTASIMLLGVYEDTGGLTYAATTAADVKAAAWLMEQGARLDWVRRYVLRPLEPEQLRLLNQLVEGAVEHQIAGVRVALTIARPSEQLEESAYVIHRYAEIFDLPVVIALLEVPPQLIVIVRSTEPQLDAGKLLAPMGGGGHATAAATRLRRRTAVEVADALLAEIAQVLGARWNAAALATPYVHTCPAAATTAAAKERMVRLRINAMPVEEGDVLIGTVTRQTLDNALAHGLGERPVTTVMRPGVTEVQPDAPVEEVERAFMEGRARFVIVPLAGGRGIITRMDLFRRLYDRQLQTGARVDRRMAGARPVVHDVGFRMRRVLAPELLEVLQSIGELGVELGMCAFLVGGAVRDVLLGRAVEDVDIVVQGNGLELARRFAARRGGRCHAHEPFLTAVLDVPGGMRLDVATARTEFYHAPAALPQVETSAIRQDLYRRDFTINAMAIDLSPERFGDLLDFFGGQRDLGQKQIRVLHSLSFLDDPTRAIRAVRFATRLGFELAAESQQLLRVAVQEGVFTRLSGTRLREELAELLEDGHPVEGLAELERLEVLHAVFPSVRWGAPLRRFLNDVEAIVGWATLDEVYTGPRWPVFLAALATRTAEDGGSAMVRRFSLAGKLAETVTSARSETERVLAVASRRGARPSEIVAVLERGDVVISLVAMAQAGDRDRRTLRQALTSWMRMPPPVTGAELLAAGVERGPVVGEALRQARAAVLDRVIPAAKALDFAVAAARELRGGE